MFEKSKNEQLRKPRSLPDFVFNALKDSIITGRIPAGTKLKQLDIAEELNVSQQTVREALKSLVAVGLVDQIRNRGFAVTHLPLKEQENIYKIRARLETFAMHEALDLITQQDLQRMRELLPQTASPDGSTPIDEVREANRKFHMTPVIATRNKHLIRIMDQLWDITWTYFHNEDAESQKSSAAKELEEHEAIIHALEQKDAVALQEATILHISDTLEGVRTHMQEEEKRSHANVKETG